MRKQCKLPLLLVLAFASAAAAQPSSLPDDNRGSLRQPVLFDHDGGVDDFITLLLLLANPQKVQVIGITTLDGDCYTDVAVNTTFKLLQLLNQPDVPVAVSTLKAVNPFPAPYRSQGIILDCLPMLNTHPSEVEALKVRQLQQQPGEEFFAQLLLQQTEKVTVIATGPLSNLAYAIQHYPAIVDKVQHVWWMGGALKVHGNVYEPHTDGSAEWNAYWDPAAMGVVWGSSVPLTLVPLDGTNKVPITPDLVYSFGPQAHHTYSSLAGSFYAPVVNWVFSTPGEPYYAWDALTAACMMDPPLCKVQTDLEVAAVLSGPGQGATVLTAGHQPGSNNQPAATTDEAAAAAAARAGAATEHAATPTDLVAATVGDLTAAAEAPSNHDGAAWAWLGRAHSSIQRVLLGRSLKAAAQTSSSSEHHMHAAASSMARDAVPSAASAAGMSDRGPGDAGYPSSPVLGSQAQQQQQQQLSAVKKVSAVMDVDAREFHTYLLLSFRQ